MARRSTSSASGPRTATPRSAARSPRFGHVSRRVRCTVARGIRPPKDVADVVDLIRRLPTYIRLVWALLRDPPVPGQQKLILAGIRPYIVLPLVLIPDFVPGL